jgi:hypothetical protein
MGTQCLLPLLLLLFLLLLQLLLQRLLREAFPQCCAFRALATNAVVVLCPSDRLCLRVFLLRQYLSIGRIGTLLLLSLLLLLLLMASPAQPSGCHEASRSAALLLLLLWLLLLQLLREAVPQRCALRARAINAVVVVYPLDGLWRHL